MTLSEAADLFRASPKSYNDLTASQKQDVRALLAPLSGFDPLQRNWFGDWWLACTQGNVDAMNAALPGKVRLAPVSHSGALYLNVDLATDCMSVGDTYFPVRVTLRTLVFTNIPNLKGAQPPGSP